MSLKKEYPLIIIGGGPAGLTASIYASRYRIPHLLVALNLGGSANEAHQVENWPGIKKIKGTELLANMWDHAKSYEPDFLSKEIKKIEKDSFGFKICARDGECVLARSIIFAGGTAYRRLTIPGENELLGRGVSYCATCDGGFFRDKTVAVIGGANSAVMSSIELAQNCKQVFLIYRGEELKGEPIWIDRIKENPKIISVPMTNLEAILGEQKVEKIKIDREYEGSKEIFLDGVFIEIGVSPLTEIAKDTGIDLDGNGSIIVGNSNQTNLAGFFAAGDVTNGSGGFRQIITASAEGAISARGAFEYLKEHKFI